MARAIRIGKRLVGPGQPVFVIAEVGSNHNRSLRLAKQLIDAAKQAGTDAVKFQTFRGDQLYSKYTPVPPKTSSLYKYFKGKTVPQAFKQWELPFSWHKSLAAYAKRRGIIFLSTPFDLGAVKLLARLKVPAYKIASYEANNLPLVRAIARQRKPVLLSTGGSDIARVRAAVDVIRRTGNRQLIVLHTVSEYPAPVERVNVRAMVTLQKTFSTLVGLSDHSEGNLAAVMAVSLGACVIEKHITLSKKLKGPDHAHATEPVAFKKYVQDIRNAELALGTGIKQPTKAELADAAGNSIVAAVNVNKGTRITSRMLTVKRPSRGIEPKDWSRVVGKIARRNIPADKWLTWADVG